MAYGSSELDVAAATVDEWLNEGSNAIDLFSKHSPMIAILYANSQEPGGEYQFKQSDVAEGNQFKLTVFGLGNSTVAGVTRANQVNALTPTVTTNLLTNTLWPWTHYQGAAYDNYEDRIKNSGKAKMVGIGEAILAQLRATFFDTIANDMWDGAAGSITKLQSINACLLNSGTVAGVDQTDATNNGWFQAQLDTTAETFNTVTFDQQRDACVFDTGLATGINRIDPDVAFLYGNLYSSLRQQLKPAQRTEVDDTLKGGAKYLMYDGVRCYRNLRQTANTVDILNSTTWTFRYATKNPDPVTPGFVPVNLRPSMYERSYNWFVGLACYSPKHNAHLSNKVAA